MLRVSVQLRKTGEGRVAWNAEHRIKGTKRNNAGHTDHECIWEGLI